MKIVFDVKGTIEGPSQKQVLALYHEFERLGHEMYVWSSLYSFATYAIKTHKLKAKPISKIERSDLDPSDYFDIAIDDENQTYLATRRLVLVQDISDDIPAFAKILIGESNGNI